MHDPVPVSYTHLEGRKFATPRGWEDLSRIIQVYEKLKKTVDADLVLQYIQHPKIARDFAAYYEMCIRERNISSTISNLFSIVFIAMGNAVAIIVGQLLGAGKMEEAKDTDTKLLFFSVASCAAVGVGMALFAPFFPRLYNTEPLIRDMARDFIWGSAFMMPINAFVNASYFTLRSGGKTVITFFFDCGYVWVVSLSLIHISPSDYRKLIIFSQ